MLLANASYGGLRRDWRDDDSSAVAEHLGDALHELRGVVADADHRVRTHLLGMIEHHVEGLGPRPLAELREQRDVAADEGLQRSADGPENRARANRDAAHHAERPSD